VKFYIVLVIALHFASTAARADHLSIPVKRPATTQAATEYAREVAHLAQTRQKLKAHPELQANPYLQVQIAIAQRFIDRLRAPTTRAAQQEVWAKVQMDEVGELLADAEQTVAQAETGQIPRVGPVPVSTGGPVKIENGLFVTATKKPGEFEPVERPFFFGGYGHFSQVFLDLPNFSQLGVTLIQDGRHGPKEGLKPDLSLTPTALEIKHELAQAAKGNVKVDILTSPHYFPQWAVDAAPDMQNGSAFHNIDHPKQREVNEAWLRKLAALLKDEPALLSYCLSNEPAYSGSGRDKYSAPAWHAFLKDRHKTIEALNALYGKSFKTFDEVPADGWSEDTSGRRWAFDWITFNNQHFAGWHKWMGDVLKKENPDALTHAKIMIFFVFDVDKQGWGIDPECFADATDIAGCDAYVQHQVGVGALDEALPKEYAYHWQVQQLSYDLLNSFRNQPVFNSENHPLPNASGSGRMSSIQTRAAMWQGGLHHQGAQTTWVWEEPTDDSFLDSIYFRPKNIWAASRAEMDLNRLSEEVAAINRAKARVAILYSPASMHWEPKYAKALVSAYTALNFMGEKVTFISERQLAEGRAADVQWIIRPMATHVSKAAQEAMTKYKTIDVGSAPMFDEYHRDCSIAGDAKIDAFTNEKSLAGQFRNVMKLKSAVELRLAGKADVPWGIEYRAVAHDGAMLVPLINMLKQPQTVTIKLDQTGAEIIDLLTGQRVSAENLELKPMEPKLLRVR
jgi:hypothetical protein